MFFLITILRGLLISLVVLIETLRAVYHLFLSPSVSVVKWYNLSPILILNVNPFSLDFYIFLIIISWHSSILMFPLALGALPSLEGLKYNSVSNSNQGGS